MKLLFAVMVAVAAASPALADNDTPTPKQRAAVMKAINAAGCTNPLGVERDDGGYEVDNAHCKGGIYDLKLSADFKIISRDREDND